MPKKTAATLKKEIGEYLAGSSVVKPHKRTTPTCVKCSRFHTTKDHEAHASSAERSDGGTTESKPAKRPARATRGSKTRESQVSGEDRLASRRLSIVREAVTSAPRRARYGKTDVFIYPVWKKVKDEIEMTLPEFKSWLVDRNREQKLSLARADLVDAMDPRLVEESEISDLGASFHFIIDEKAREREHWMG